MLCHSRKALPTPRGLRESLAPAARSACALSQEGAPEAAVASRILEDPKAVSLRSSQAPARGPGGLGLSLTQGTASSPT